jgi:phosphoadenosine phosphosulfate reductase
MSAVAPKEIADGLAPEAVLRWAFDTFPRVAIVASFQAESSVLIDMATRVRPNAHVLTLDTGRLPQATYDMIDRVRDRYGIDVEVVSPDAGEVADMVRGHGVNLFYQSPDLRRHCCDVRKSRPLARALLGYDAWVTGVRRQQAATRMQTPAVALDPEHAGLTKIAPLVDWSKDQVWSYIRDHDLPYHALYERGYTSIGCEPCTRATVAGEDERAGRWWWEQGEAKECGLHFPTRGEVGPARPRARPDGDSPGKAS